MEPDFIVVLVTTSSEEEALHIAQLLLKEKLAACIQTGIPIRSFFSWENKLQDEQEQLMLIKSRKDCFRKLVDRIRELHSYDVPEIIALPVYDGNPDYLEWLEKETDSL